MKSFPENKHLAALYLFASFDEAKTILDVFGAKQMLLRAEADGLPADVIEARLADLYYADQLMEKASFERERAFATLVEGAQVGAGSRQDR